MFHDLSGSGVQENFLDQAGQKSQIFILAPWADNNNSWNGTNCLALCHEYLLNGYYNTASVTTSKHKHSMSVNTIDYLRNWGRRIAMGSKQDWTTKYFRSTWDTKWDSISENIIYTPIMWISVDTNMVL